MAMDTLPRPTNDGMVGSWDFLGRDQASHMRWGKLVTHAMIHYNLASTGMTDCPVCTGAVSL